MQVSILQMWFFNKKKIQLTGVTLWPKVVKFSLKLTMFRKSTSLFSWFNPRSHAAVIIAFIATSTGNKSAGKSGLQCIERTTPAANYEMLKMSHMEIDVLFCVLPRAAPTINPVGPFMPSTQPGYGSFHAAVTVDSEIHQWIFWIDFKLHKKNIYQ